MKRNLIIASIFFAGVGFLSIPGFVNAQTTPPPAGGSSPTPKPALGGTDNNTVRILFSCTGTCKASSREVVMPKDILREAKTGKALPSAEAQIKAVDSRNAALRAYLRMPEDKNEDAGQTFKYEPEPIYAWVQNALEGFERSTQEPELKIENGEAKSFIPPQDGLQVSYRATTENILQALSKSEAYATASLVVQQPKKQLGDTNDMGILELIGRGESNFKGSPANRRHNINVGIEKLKGTILPAGKDFSFNENICPVDKSTGYKPELVIKAEGTIPEYGGGLCQVSSTTFRAAMNAGLKIVQRKNHSYAVQYYAPQGTDATTYCEGVDFKFNNDTKGAILIWPYLKDKDTLVFDFYGTKDSRVVELDKPVQYDKKSDGSMKANWTRRVTINGKTQEETFNSNYLPPALFHKEEVLPAAPTPSTVTAPTPSPTPPVVQ